MQEKLNLPPLAGTHSADTGARSTLAISVVSFETFFFFLRAFLRFLGGGCLRRLLGGVRAGGGRARVEGRAHSLNAAARVDVASAALVHGLVLLGGGGAACEGGRG